MKVALFLVFTLALGVPALAGDDDHERALQAVRQGQILPLKMILDRAQLAQRGSLIEAELEDERGGSPVYEITVLTAENVVVKLTYDARTGEPISRHRREDRN